MTVGELRGILRDLVDDYVVKVCVPGGDYLEDIAAVLLVESLADHCEWVEVRLDTLE
jgi:hypothetical protein